MTIGLCVFACMLLYSELELLNVFIYPLIIRSARGSTRDGTNGVAQMQCIEFIYSLSELDMHIHNTAFQKAKLITIASQVHVDKRMPLPTTDIHVDQHYKS